MATRQIAASMYRKGSFEEWQKVIKLFEPHPKALVALYTSVAAVIVKAMGKPNPRD